MTDLIERDAAKTVLNWWRDHHLEQAIDAKARGDDAEYDARLGLSALAVAIRAEIEKLPSIEVSS